MWFEQDVAYCQFKTSKRLTAKIQNMRRPLLCNKQFPTVTLQLHTTVLTYTQTLRLKCRRHMFIIIFPILVINQYILWWQSIANKRAERVGGFQAIADLTGI